MFIPCYKFRTFKNFVKPNYYILLKRFATFVVQHMF